jgi:hypothetical protein
MEWHPMAQKVGKIWSLPLSAKAPSKLLGSRRTGLSPIALRFKRIDFQISPDDPISSSQGGTGINTIEANLGYATTADIEGYLRVER